MNDEQGSSLDQNRACRHMDVAGGWRRLVAGRPARIPDAARAGRRVVASRDDDVLTSVERGRNRKLESFEPVVIRHGDASDVGAAGVALGAEPLDLIRILVASRRAPVRDLQ